MKKFFMKLFDNNKREKSSSDGKSPFFNPLVLGGAIGGGSFLFLLIIVVLVVIIVLSPIMLAQEYITEIKDEVSDFFEKVGNVVTLGCWGNDEYCEASFDNKYYIKLDEIYQDYKDNGVELDTDLITATIYYDKTVGQDDVDSGFISDISDLSSVLVSGSSGFGGTIGGYVSSMSGSLHYDEYRDYLIKTYIPKRYSYLYTNDNGKTKIADEIMSYADYNSSQIASSFSGLGISCSQITLKEDDGSINVHDLEEYVAGVVTAENGGAGPEARKVQALAARTNAVTHCNSVIDNTANFQKYKTPTSAGTEAAEATKGLVLTYNGELLKEMPFASYPMANYRGGFPGYESLGYTCSDVTCSTGSDGRQWCETTLYKVPNMDKYQLKMPDTTTNGSLWNGLHLNNQKGHCYGVSQVASIYYEKELNYDYEKMVKEFFSDGVEISSMSSGFSGQVGSTDGTSFLPYELSKFLSEKGSSVESFNASIKQAVVTAGPGTRAGVIAATNALINGLAQYGVKLPYISSTGASGGASGKYNGYGVLAEWGTKGKWHSSYYHHDYTQMGLDCSGLVSWAIHNGGFKYLDYNSGGFLDNVGTSHSFSSYRGKPGDLVVMYGHIGLIIGVTDSEYIVAEEHGGENGLEVTHYTFNNPRKQFSHILDMTSYYSNSSNLDLAYYQGG